MLKDIKSLEELDKIINERDIHKKNIRDMQEQLAAAYKRIAELNTELNELKRG
tara:strand:+ start:784 stop:942 length:159 start_codon:yes stop_codon:yes gene_type:complete